VTTSSSVTTQASVSQNTRTVTLLMIVETGLMNEPAVSGSNCVYLTTAYKYSTANTELASQYEFVRCIIYRVDR